MHTLRGAVTEGVNFHILVTKSYTCPKQHLAMTHTYHLIEAIISIGGGKHHITEQEK